LVIAVRSTLGAAGSRPIDAASVRFALETIDQATPPAVRWRALERRAAPSFFQSWDWVGPWLACLPPARRPCFAVGRAEGREVALGVLVFGRRRRLGLQPIRVAYLHDSCVAAERTPTIEYNGLLLDQALGPGVLDGFARWLLDGLAVELVLPGIRADEVLGSGLINRSAIEPAPYIDLAALRARRVAYRDSLSANTRYQVGRALRDYAARGPVIAQPAGSLDQALAFWDRLAALHQASWTARGRPGAFAAPFFGALHRRIIQVGFARGAVQLIRVTAGGDELGYLYNLVRDGRVAAYQSGFAYESTTRSKPGLVSHVLAIEHNLAAGAVRYDFLAGLNQMKQSLASNIETLSWNALQHRTFGALVEDRCRSLKSRLNQIGAKSGRNIVISRCK
jgi:CelD/BcsL family acetyltransferase involved in cellulose biosynthesis